MRLWLTYGMAHRGISRRRDGLAHLSLLVAAMLAFAGCGQPGSSTPGTQTGTPTPAIAHVTPTPTNPPAPNLVPPPYSFQRTWQAASGAPAHIGTFTFAPSAPRIGYACAMGPDTTAATPSVFYSTTDGGQSWRLAQTTLFGANTGCNIFVDQSDAADVFLLTYTQNSQGQTVNQVYRSRDGGSTWKEISTVHDPAYTLLMENIAVVGNRLVTVVGISGEGRVPDPLYASDDGGASWHAIGQSIIQQQLAINEQIWVAGTRLIVGAVPPCQGCGPLNAPLTGDSDSGNVLHTTISTSSGNPAITYYFASVDGGTTWNKMSLPSDRVTWMSYTRSADGTHVYGAAIEQGTGLGPWVPIPLFSEDGTSWRALPTLQNVEGGYPDATQVYGVMVATDGSVLVPTYHTLPGNMGDSDAGYFRLRPGSGQSWQPLVNGINIYILQTVPMANGGTRAWAVQNQTDHGGTLVYIDLPA